MKLSVVKIETLRCALRSSCPYILFAFADSSAGSLNGLKTLQLWVYIERSKSYLEAIGEILDAVEKALPDTECELVILNKVDARTRSASLSRTCLYIRENCEGIYWQYIDRVGQERHAGHLHPKCWHLENRLIED